MLPEPSCARFLHQDGIILHHVEVMRSKFTSVEHRERKPIRQRCAQFLH